MIKTLVLLSFVCATYGQFNEDPTQIKALVALQCELGNSSTDPMAFTCNSRSCDPNKYPGHPNCCSTSLGNFCCEPKGTVCCDYVNTYDIHFCCTDEYPVCALEGALEAHCKAGGSRLGAIIYLVVTLSIFLIGSEKIGFSRNLM